LGRITRRAILAVATGALTGLAAFGAALPVPLTPTGHEGPGPVAGNRGGGPLQPAVPTDKPNPPGRPTPSPTPTPPDDGELGAPIPPGADPVLAGAAVRSIAPQPPDGVHWETDHGKCAILSVGTLEAIAGGDLGLTDHLASTGSPWPENPDCIYMGGYGIGPMNPITSVDEAHDLAVRAFAAIDDQGHALVLAVVDAEGWFWDYAKKCDDCGIKQITERMGAELDIDPAGIVIAATHSHTAPDFLGGWGFVPDWYMEQVTRTIEDAIRDAVTSAVPAVLEVGEERARAHNRERRGTYRSAEEQQISWLRALAIDGDRFVLDAERGVPAVIGTVGAYAAHPVTRDHENGVAHPDWPGVFATRLEERFGGVGMHFMTGLGNLSPSGGTPMGSALADVLPPVAAGRILDDTDIRVTRTTWNQPATNVPLTALAGAGFFDHAFDGGPSHVQTGKSPNTAPCVSASPVSVEVPVAAARIGSRSALTTGPGELFANLTNTIKEKSGAEVTMPLGQANDSLGYIPQSFELNPVGQQGLGFAAGGYLIVNYEDSYAIDRCFGDMVLETTLTLLDTL
jgi:hypothetical protein